MGNAAFAENLNLGDSNTVDTSGRLWLDMKFNVPCYICAGSELNAGQVILSFTHYIDVESGYDDGNIKMAINNQDFTLVRGGAAEENGYTETLVDQNHGSSNP